MMKNKSIVILLLLLVLMALVFHNPTINNSYNESSSNRLVVTFEELMKEPYVLPQDHPKLIEHIQRKLSPPSKMPYNLRDPNTDPSQGQPREIINILGEMKNGFFVECGGMDGEFFSNTLMLEKMYGWSGLLVEADPKNYIKLVRKNRKVWSIQACLSTQPYPHTVYFRQHKDTGHISNLSASSNLAGYTEVQCVPLYSILLALNRTTIDYFSLDVEGVEMPVLRTIPWDKLNIRTVSVEFLHLEEGADYLLDFMASKGYYPYTKSGKKLDGRMSDYIFYRHDVNPKKPRL